MERITYTDKPGLKPLVRSTEALKRLAAYEDTGLEPEEIRELATAKKDGRLVVLPYPQHSTLLDTSMTPKLIKDVRVSISYTQDGVIYSQPFGIFLENVKNGYITPVGEEVGAALKCVKIARGYWPCAYAEIDSLPAADVEPVRHGRWYAMCYVSGILEGTKNDKCSVCGYERVYEDETYKTRYYYCPRCGSKMDSEEPE